MMSSLATLITNIVFAIDILNTVYTPSCQFISYLLKLIHYNTTDLQQILPA